MFQQYRQKDISPLCKKKEPNLDLQMDLYPSFNHPQADKWEVAPAGGRGQATGETDQRSMSQVV